ncbi:MAG TPA: hypothetical protein DCO79_13200 [Spirochaeta sp.]|nr:hypothetical protein [Spirochaeta sp.]
MNFLLGVEIDNSRIVWIYNSERSSTRPVRLTTVSENQQKADIKFYIKSKDKKHFLCSESITGLPAMSAGEPSIDIKPGVSGKTFYYEIYINGKLVRRSSHDLSRYLRSKVPFFAAGGLLAAAAVILLIVLVLIPMFTENNQIVAEKKAEQLKTADPAVVEPPETEIKEQKPAEPLPEPQPARLVFIEREITDRYSVYFQPESDKLTAEAVSGLRVFIDKLPKENDFEEAQFELEIRGHCARYGTEEGRAELSKERALKVYSFLKTGWGIEADSFVTGAGASEPVSLKRDEQHLNRRVDINIKGNLKKIETTD